MFEGQGAKGIKRAPLPPFAPAHEFPSGEVDDFVTSLFVLYLWSLVQRDLILEF